MLHYTHLGAKVTFNLHLLQCIKYNGVDLKETLSCHFFAIPTCETYGLRAKWGVLVIR